MIEFTNTLIESLLSDFKVDGESIPVSYMFYEGHGEPYITYFHQDSNNSFAGDDELLGYVEYYDFDVYSKGNYLKIIESLKEILEANGFRYQPSRSSIDMYEPDTLYYHKTLNFGFLKEV